MKIKLSIVAFGLSAVFALGAIASPIYAIDNIAMTDEEKAEYIAEYKKEAAEKKEQYKAEAEKRAAELKAEAQNRAEESKKQATEKNKEAYEKRLEQRKQFCEKNQEALQKKLQNKSEIANKYQERFDGFYDKIIRFIEDKDLDIENYADLSAAVLDTKESAAIAASSITELNTNIDCQDVELTAQEFSVYKDTVNDAKEALKAYKDALVDLLVGVKTSYSNGQASEAVVEEGSENE